MSLLGRQSFPCSTACFGQSTVHRAAGDPQGVSDVLNSHVAGIVGSDLAGAFDWCSAKVCTFHGLLVGLIGTINAASSRYACKRILQSASLAKANFVPVAAVRKQRSIFLSPILPDSENFPPIWRQYHFILDRLLWDGVASPSRPTVHVHATNRAADGSSARLRFNSRELESSVRVREMRPLVLRIGVET